MVTQPKPLVQWFGGKARMARIIANKMPGHKIYVEPFGGAAGVLMAKQPAEIEIYNDLHSGIVNLFRVVRNPDKCQALINLLEFTPYSREEWRDCTKTWENELDDVEKARKFFTSLEQNFIGNTSGGSWGFGGKLHGTNKAKTFANSLPNLRAVCERLRGVLIENSPALNVMRQWDAPDTLIYADPPYLPETRSKIGDYKHELTTDHHVELLEFLLQAKSKIILSGYPSKLYSEALESNGWKREDYSAIAASALNSTNNGLKGRPADFAKRTESLWINPAAALPTLWDFEREVI